MKKLTPISSKRMIVYLLFLFVIVVVMILLRKDIKKEFAPRDFEEIANEGIMHIAVDYSPISYYVQDDTIIGFEYELLQLLQQETPIKFNITPVVSLAASIDGLVNEEYDVVARAIPTTSEMQEQYLFTIPILQKRQLLVQRTAKANGGKEPLRTQTDLAKVTLHIVENGATRQRIENLSAEIGDTILIKSDTHYNDQQLIQLVAMGVIDFAVCDYGMVMAMKAQYPQIDYYTSISFTQFQSWAMRHTSPQLQDSLNKWLRKIEKTPQYKNLYQKYF